MSISKDALHQRVVRAFKSSIPDMLKEINVLTSPSSVASALTPQTSTTDSPRMTSPTMTMTLMNATSPVTKAGRPKGSSMVEKRKALISVRECIDEIVSEYSRELASCKQVGRHIKKSYLKTLVEKKKQKDRVSSEISHSTILLWSWRGISKSNGQGV